MIVPFAGVRRRCGYVTIGLVQVLVSIMFVSCSSPRSDSPSDQMDGVEMAINKDSSGTLGTTIQVAEVDSVIEIKFPNGVSFHWNNRSYRIVDDSLYTSIDISSLAMQEELAKLITDSTKTHAAVCTLDRNLSIGELAFLLLNKAIGLPFFYILQTQLDVFDLGCPYPTWLFDVIDRDRSGVRERVERYLVTGEAP